MCRVCQEGHLPWAFDTQITQAPVIDPWPSFQPYQIFRTLTDVANSAAQGCGTCKHVIDCLPNTLAKPEEITICLAGSSWASYPRPSKVQGDIHIPMKHLTMYLNSLGYKISVCGRTSRDFRFAQARSWLQNCIKVHPDCVLPPHHHKTFVPTRLLNVGSLRRHSLRLIHPKRKDLGDTRYIALSHLWGPQMADSSKTLTSNIKARLKRIDESTLSKSFLDGIAFARFLNIKYVWIDALCIIQDSKKDTKREIPNMHKIYIYSWCTFAASSYNITHLKDYLGDVGQYLRGQVLSKEASENESLLLLSFNMIMSQMFMPINKIGNQSYEASRRMQWIDGLNSIPLHGRGWILQERELSIRVFHYSPAITLWECHSLRASERDDVGFSDHGSLWHGALRELTTLSRYRLGDIYDCQRTPQPFGLTLKLSFRQEMDDIFNAWIRAVEDYSQRKLTYLSDKSAAILGLANEMRIRTGSRDICGLWPDDIFRGLLWCKSSLFDQDHVLLPAISAHDYTGLNYLGCEHRFPAPSWSWLGATFPISYEISRNDGSGTQDDPLLPTILKYHSAQLQARSAKPKPEGGWISLKGRVCRLDHVVNEETRGGTEMKLYLDCASATVSDIFLLLVFFRDPKLSSLTPHGKGLLLHQLSGTNEVYRRVGVANFIPNTTFDKVDARTITII